MATADDVIAGLLDKSLETASINAHGWHDRGQGPGSVHGQFVKWLTFGDLAGSVADDVARIRAQPLVPRTIPIYGYIYDVRSGNLQEVAEATRLGRAD